MISRTSSFLRETSWNARSSSTWSFRGRIIMGIPIMRLNLQQIDLTIPIQLHNCQKAFFHIFVSLFPYIGLFIRNYESAIHDAYKGSSARKWRGTALCDLKKSKSREWRDARSACKKWWRGEDKEREARTGGWWWGDEKAWKRGKEKRRWGKQTYSGPAQG